ncbi:condensation domain-containing protein [Streptomyces sp. NPDC004327]|uniref:condensation domain-containing protein n=1 Tax=Streptomyces sp. NPDC004327 TaxID=3364699 RepID=UPI0036BF2B09
MTASGFVTEELARLWSELLGVGEPAPGAEFAALGGGPEAAGRLAVLIDEELGLTVSPAELLGAGTFAAMAEVVDAAMKAPPAGPTTSGTGISATVPGPAPAAFPNAFPAADVLRALPRGADARPALSFAQQRLWFMQQIDPETTLYNVPTVLRLRGALDRAALGLALDAVVARHEVLRTTYAAPAGVPHQVIAAPAPVPLPFTDVSASGDPEAEARRIADEAARHVFDLAAAPPLAARLVRVAADDHRLVVTFHHVAIDGGSVEVFYRELGLLYGSPEGLPGAALQYADLAEWQRARLTGGTLDALVGHWRAVLGEDPRALELPTDRPRPRSKSFRGAVSTRLLPAELVGAVRAFGRGERATANMTHLAALFTLLAEWSGSEDVTVGIPAAGRTRPELQDLVGCLINMVPVRAGLAGEPGFRTLVGRVRAAVLDAAAHQELPFDKLVEALVTRRSRDFTPVFRVMFSYLGERRAPVFAGLGPCELDLTGPQDTAKYDLSLYVEERGGDAVELTLEYDTDLYGPDTAAALLAAYERTLAEAVADPDTPVGRLPAARSFTATHRTATHREEARP